MISRSFWLVMCSLLLCESIYRPVQAYSVLGKRHKHGDLGQGRQQTGQEDADEFSGEATSGDPDYSAGVQMMGMTTSNNTADTIERLVGDILLWNSMLASSNVRLGYCNSHAEEVLENMDITGIVALVTRIAIYEDEGCEDAATRLAQSVVRALGVKPHQIHSLLHEECVGNKEDPMACENRVHDILELLPDIIILYTTAAAAVYGSDHQAIGETRAKELARFLDIPEDVFLEDNNSSVPSREKRGTCVDKKEAKAQKVISWIPFVGTVYNLISSAVYAGKGCKSVAKERAIEGSIDLGADLITAVTFGAGSGVATGVKTAVKAGVKMGGKAALKQGGKAGIKRGKSVIKETLKQTGKSYANPIKAAAKEVVDTGKLVAKVPKTIKKIPKVVKKIPTAVKNIPGSAKTAWRSLFGKTPDAGKKWIGDIPAVHKICKRSDPGCSVTYHNLLNQKEPRELNLISNYQPPSGARDKINKFKQRYSEAKVTEAEALEIYRYTTIDGYMVLNDAMRRQDLTNDLMNRAKLLQNGVLKVQQAQQKNPCSLRSLKMCFGRGRTLYRRGRMWEGFENMYEEGETIRMHAFTSTSTYSSSEFPGNIKYTIKTNKGAAVKRISAFPKEYEVLLPAGLEFHVDKVTRDESFMLVELTEVA